MTDPSTFKITVRRVSRRTATEVTVTLNTVSPTLCYIVPGSGPQNDEHAQVQNAVNALKLEMINAIMNAEVTLVEREHERTK